MSRKHENDPDGVVGRDEAEMTESTDETTAEADEMHENVRESTEGVETRADYGPGGTAGGGSDAATSLIGNGAMTDPRYLAQR